MINKILLAVRLPLLSFSILNFCFINQTVADVPKEQVKEVSHLLEFVKNSPCTFNRNGSKYPGKEGIKHIQKKYNYFRDDIETTEDFIKYSATKSTMSGKYYTVSCPDSQEIKSKDWLLGELEQFRSAQQ